MNLIAMKNQSFPNPTENEWKQEVEKTLKGESTETLNRDTYENIVLKPLYSREGSAPASDFPGCGDFRRGLHATPSAWKIAQRICAQSPVELTEALKSAFKRGQTAIAFEPNAFLFEKSENLAKELSEVLLHFPFAVNAKEYHSQLLSQLKKLPDNDKLKGFVARDPIADFSQNGEAAEIPPSFFNTWKMEIENFPHLQTILVDTVPYHNDGANAVQEIAFALAKGVHYIQELQEAGMDTEQIFKAMIFQFALGSNFFMEIAKLRAARLLWNKIGEAFGISASSRGMHISAETSVFTTTIYDRHVNLLRTGNQAFAAALGGVQYLHVYPFDELIGVTELSDRLARNTQLILQEETQLKNVIDPAGGSWYIEALTKELAEKAWDFFLKIEDGGGILQATKSGMIEEEISFVFEKRLQDVYYRKQSMIGTNVYAHAAEQNPGGGTPGSTGKRLSMPYEEIRAGAAKIESSKGFRPAVGLLCLGALREHKARMDFVTGFLAAGGFLASNSGTINSEDSAREFVVNADTRYFCLCGSDLQYEETGLEILKSLKAEFPDRTFYLAGLPKPDRKQRWIEAGITDFISSRSNCHALLSDLLNKMEVHFNEKGNS